ncbi:MAG: hypothetical protein JXR76_13275 [Deltaproteobacteria bacterium]|nr:hypothetical protein [Deltaproteobacteria bacterium]
MNSGNHFCHQQRHFVGWPMALCALTVLLSASNVFANRIGAFYLEPHLGAARVQLTAVEIERSFVTTVSGKDFEKSQNINLDGVIAPVGRMIGYKGSGMEVGFTTGIKVSGLKLGFTLTCINVSFAGYSKRYRYETTRLRAVGIKYKDSDNAPILRLLGTVKYGIPILGALLQFQTRIGKMIVRDTMLIMGRAIEKEDGLTADVGIELGVRPKRWFSVGFLVYGGFFAYKGKYEGGMGSLFGGNGTVSIFF